MTTLSSYAGTAHVVEVIGLFWTDEPNRQIEIAGTKDEAHFFAVYVRRSCADEITAEQVLSLAEWHEACEAAELIADQLKGTLADAMARYSDLLRLIALSQRAGAFKLGGRRASGQAASQQASKSPITT